MRPVILLALALASASPALADPASPPGPEAVPAAAPSAAPAAVPADPSPEVARFELGVSASYAYGLGRETRDAMMPDLTFGTVPLVLDVGYALGTRFALGAYLGFGPMFPNGCPTEVSCSGSSLRFGLRARYRFGEGDGFLPWVSLGAGFERLTETARYQDSSVDSAVNGLELVRAELGFDQKVSGRFSLGPFAGFSVGEFYSRELQGEGSGISPRLPHFWLSAGLRGAFWL